MLLALASVLLAPPAAAPFVVQSADSAEVRVGAVRTIAPDLALEFDPQPGRANPGIPAGKLVSLQRAGVARPGFPLAPGVVLTNGDRIAGSFAGGDTRKLDFAPSLPGAPSLAVPLLGLSALWLAPVPGDLPADPARYPWLAPKRDTLLTRSGDVLAGALDTAQSDPPGFRWQSPDKTRAARPADAVAAIVLDPSLARPGKLTGPAARVVFADGSRLTLREAELLGGELRGRTAWGEFTRWPWTQVVALDALATPALVPLGELKPLEDATTGYLGAAFPSVVNRSARHEPLRVRTDAGVETFDSGVGVHSQSQLKYAAPEGATRFESLVGLDPTSGQGGAAVVRVLLDGKDVTKLALGVQSPELGGADVAAVVRLAVKAGQVLTLRVEFGASGDAEDVVNWAQARFVRE